MLSSFSKVQDGGPMIFRMFGITKHCIPEPLNPQQNQREHTYMEDEGWDLLDDETQDHR
jgi:hypothetical protein